MADSQTYQIPDVPLIPQALNMACWYASAKMLVAWRQNQVRACEFAHPDPSEVPTLEAGFVANDGLTTDKIVDLAKSLGLQAVSPMCPSPGTIATMLQTYGPLWFAGLHPSGHVVVITGICADVIDINDPWPPNRGTVRRIALSRFGEINVPLSYYKNESFTDELKILLGIQPSQLASNLLHFPESRSG